MCQHTRAHKRRRRRGSIKLNLFPHLVPDSSILWSFCSSCNHSVVSHLSPCQSSPHTHTFHRKSKIYTVHIYIFLSKQTRLLGMFLHSLWMCSWGCELAWHLRSAALRQVDASKLALQLTRRPLSLLYYRGFTMLSFSGRARALSAVSHMALNLDSHHRNIYCSFC